MFVEEELKKRKKNNSLFVTHSYKYKTVKFSAFNSSLKSSWQPLYQLQLLSCALVRGTDRRIYLHVLDGEGNRWWGEHSNSMLKGLALARNRTLLMLAIKYKAHLSRI